MNAIKRKPKAAARATRVISDPDDVAFICLMLGGRESRPGEVLELRHVRDRLWELREAVDTKTKPPQKSEAARATVTTKPSEASKRDT